MRINILNSGDQVISVTSQFLAIQRASGEVDILPLTKGEDGPKIDEKHILTIGYAETTIQTETVNGVTIMNF